MSKSRKSQQVRSWVKVVRLVVLSLAVFLAIIVLILGGLTLGGYAPIGNLRAFAEHYGLIRHAVLAPAVMGQPTTGEFGPSAPLNTNPAQVINDFGYEVLLQGVTPEPMDIKFSPDGRLWITGRRGEVWQYSLETKALKQVAALQVAWQPVPSEAASNERGLHGIEFDPGYLKNGYIYLFYSTASGGLFSSRVSRFTVAQKSQGDELIPNSEKILVEFPSVYGMHQGGALSYNPKDGKLYVSTGENYVAPNRTMFYGLYVPKTPTMDLSSFRGKTLRLNLDGSIPSDNPFVNKRGARGEIYTIGHRNPFSMDIDSATGRVFVGEVGADEGSWEEINLLKEGGNYGWPFAIGRDVATVGVGKSYFRGGIDAWFCYVHDQSASITCGPFYRASKGRFAFPAEWQDGLFYADLMRKSVRFVQVDPQTNAAIKSVPFATGFAGGPIAMRQGPDGALYIAEYAGWFSGSVNDRISRITYDPHGEGARRAHENGLAPVVSRPQNPSQAVEDQLAPYREALAGGDAAKGKAIFDVQCARCHKIKGQGGDIGPDLSLIRPQKDRQFLLESIVFPNKEIAPGFQYVIVVLKNGRSYSGTLKSENPDAIVVRSPDDGMLTLKRLHIQEVRKGPSLMPEGFGQILSKQDVSNVVEYLAQVSKSEKSALIKAAPPQDTADMEPNPLHKALLLCMVVAVVAIVIVGMFLPSNEDTTER